MRRVRVEVAWSVLRLSLIRAAGTERGSTYVSKTLRTRSSDVVKTAVPSGHLALSVIVLRISSFETHHLADRKKLSPTSDSAALALSDRTARGAASKA